jgi:hypothetical protein
MSRHPDSGGDADATETADATDSIRLIRSFRLHPIPLFWMLGNEGSLG